MLELTGKNDDSLANAVLMINACRQGDTDTVRRLIREDARLIDCKADNGRFPPLHYAVREGHAAIAKILIDEGADPSPFEHMMRNHLGITTLDIARARGFTDVVAVVEQAIAAKHGGLSAQSEIKSAIQAIDLAKIGRLVRQDAANATAVDDDGNTPLHRAAEGPPTRETMDLIDCLVEQGANIHAANALGFKAIDLTIFRNHLWCGPRPRPGLTGFLLARGAEYTINIACVNGDLKHVRKLLKQDPTLANYQAESKKRPLSCAAEFGHRDVVKLLLEKGADPNAQEAEPYKTYPLLAAARRRDVAMARMLLEHGADPEAYEDSAPNAISTAYEYGDREMCDLLASYGASISPADFAWKCDLPILSSMLKSNPSIANELLSYNDESKPEKSIMVINLAFKYGADPKKVGQWALYRSQSAPKMLKAFLEHGVDPNTSDREGKTTLHAMAGLRDIPQLEAAELLLEYGADINAKDDVYQGTPLAWAAILGKKEYVAFLLDKGAKTNLADDEPWSTPLFWAEYKGHTEIAELLKRHGATR